MKMITSFLLGAVFVSQAAFAEMNISKSVYRLNQLEEAKAEAAEEEKPLVFVLTDPGTT